MASERDLQALEENDDELLDLQTRMRVEGYLYEPRRAQSPVLSDDSATEWSDSDDSDVETPGQRRQQRPLLKLGNTVVKRFYYNYLFHLFENTSPLYVSERKKELIV